MKKIEQILTIAIIVLLASCSTEGLNIQNDKEIKIVQRGSKVINGSEGDVELMINDITNGSTEVRIENIESGKMYFKSYLKEGEYGIFRYGEYFYRVKINSFEEHLFHDDYAFIAFRSVSKERGLAEAQKDVKQQEVNITPDEVRAFLNKVKTSGLKFIRNNEIVADSLMAIHLENKYIINNKDIKTKSDFINKVIGKSSLTGEEYKVITSTNDTVSIIKWLKL